MDNSYLHPEFLAQKAQAGSVGFFGRKCFALGHAIKCDDAPAAELDLVERCKDCGEVNASLTQFYPLVAFNSCWTPHIFEVQEEQPMAVLADCCRWVAATLQIVRNVEFEGEILGIGFAENCIDRLRRLANRVHVVVKAELDAEVRRSLAD